MPYRARGIPAGRAARAVNCAWSAQARPFATSCAHASARRTGRLPEPPPCPSPICAKSYEKKVLLESDAAASPFDQFTLWFDEALASRYPNPTP